MIRKAERLALPLILTLALLLAGCGAAQTFGRQQELLKLGNASKLVIDQAELALLSARMSRIDAGRLLEGALCRSPLNGTVLSRHVELYDELPPDTPTFTVADLGRMRIEIGIPENEVAGVAAGKRASVRLDLYPAEEWERPEEGKTAGFHRRP